MKSMIRTATTSPIRFGPLFRIEASKYLAHRLLPALLSVSLLMMVVATASAQGAPGTRQPNALPGRLGTQLTGTPLSQGQKDAQRAEKARLEALQQAMIGRAERDGVGARLDALCHFRGTWSQQLMGVGLVTGLDRTGDSQSYTATQIAAANLLKRAGVGVDITAFNSKNIALVTVTCELPPYSSPGQRVDITVSAMGDASSLRNGTLILTPLKYPGSDEVYATGDGHISVGGFAAKSGGNSSSRGFVTVGRIPGGAIVQQGVETKTVFSGKIYLDLDQQDIVTAHRIEERISESYPELLPRALGAGSIEMTLPANASISGIEANLMALVVQANTEAKVVVDERSGTIIIGGNVRLAPCAIARGSISVQVSTDNSIFGDNSALQTKEDTAQVSLLKPNTTVADLAEIFQALKLKADDIIAILENLKAQGALKAKLEIQ